VTSDLRERLDASFDEGPPHRPVEERLAAGRRAVRRRRRVVTAGTAAALVVLAIGPVALRPTAGGGGGIDLPLPHPTPTTTAVPTPVHLLVLLRVAVGTTRQWEVQVRHGRAVVCRCVATAAG